MGFYVLYRCLSNTVKPVPTALHIAYSPWFQPGEFNEEYRDVAVLGSYLFPCPLSGRVSALANQILSAGQGCGSSPLSGRVSALANQILSAGQGCGSVQPDPQYIPEIKGIRIRHLDPDKTLQKKTESGSDSRQN